MEGLTCLKMQQASARTPVGALVIDPTTLNLFIPIQYIEQNFPRHRVSLDSGLRSL